MEAVFPRDGLFFVGPQKWMIAFKRQNPDISDQPSPNMLRIYPRTLGVHPSRETIGVFGRDRILTEILVAWDFSRPAARAAADALPLLKMAKQVFVVTVTIDKEIKSSRSGVELAKHFSRHGVEVIFEEVPRSSNPIDNTVLAHATARHVDLIVMGGYGHSQLREFVLGGATRGMLDSTDRPVLFSH